MQKAILIIAFALIAIPLYAQQDPRDPGIQDSLIIGQADVDPGGIFANVPVYAVTDDSVGFYNTPLRWYAPFGGIYGGTGVVYFPPLNLWAIHYDSVMLSESYYRIIGFYDFVGDTVPPLITHGARWHIFTLRFVIDPNAPRQLVAIDTTFDDRNGSPLFGLVDGITGFAPGVMRSFFWIGGTGIGDDSELPMEFSLSQNYPNPFNPSTNIAFSLSAEGKASLVIYDLLGREVRTVLDDRLEAGSYSLVWDGRDKGGWDVPSGVYFYRLAAGDKAETRRMTLVR